MKYIVLISDGIFDHDFKLFSTKEEAETWANKIKNKHYSVVVTELSDKIYL